MTVVIKYYPSIVLVIPEHAQSEFERSKTQTMDVSDQEENIPSTTRSGRKYLRAHRAGNITLTTLKDQIRDLRLSPRALPQLPAWMQRRRWDQNEAYVPFPKITFLVDRPPALLCQICRDSKLKSPLYSTSANGKGDVDDTTFSILPCGHVAGSTCLEIWCSNNDRCPFCRQDLRYRVCKHNIMPTPITKEGIHLVPRTLPEGGKIPDYCKNCLKRGLAEEADKELAKATNRFRELRRRAHKSRRGNEEELLKAKEEVETVWRDHMYAPHVHFLLNEW